MKSYFRPEIDALAGYTPGEQPKIPDLVKLNTNENPYPPSPKVIEAFRNFDVTKLRRYPDPCADNLRDDVANEIGLNRDNVIIGNGSDDLLTMIFRSFSAPDRPVAVFEPSYSLYPILAAMQGASVIKVHLDKDDFSAPADTLEQIKGANLLMITRPNAPTGTSFPKETVKKWCASFDGVVVIDEAYQDFADDNCGEFAGMFNNVIVMRTFSKGSSLAGLRMGYAFGAKNLINGLMKLKDSYNVDMLAQTLARASFNDREYRANTTERICAQRSRLSKELSMLGFKVIPSQSNFIFTEPPDQNGEAWFNYLREHGILVRHFPGKITGTYLRITIGTQEENEQLLKKIREHVSQHE